jgi:hypothetical protein
MAVQALADRTKLDWAVCLLCACTPYSRRSCQLRAGLFLSETSRFAGRSISSITSNKQILLFDLCLDLILDSKLNIPRIVLSFDMPRTTRAAAKALEVETHTEESTLSSSETGHNIANAKIPDVTENALVEKEIEPVTKKSKAKKKGGKSKKSKKTKAQNEEAEVSNGIEDTPVEGNESQTTDEVLKNEAVEGGESQGTQQGK